VGVDLICWHFQQFSVSIMLLLRCLRCCCCCCQAIESTLAELEFKLTHESLSAAQEKALREKKDRMERQDKPAVARLAQVSAKIDEAKAASDAIRAEIAVLNGTLDKIKAEREAANAKLDAMRAEQQEARSDIPGLMVEKKELWEVIQTLRDKQREIRDSFNKKWEEFKKQDKAWKGWFAQERKRRCAQCLVFGGQRVLPAAFVCLRACFVARKPAWCQLISTCLCASTWAAGDPLQLLA
jgi:uncharacterized coiled-coil DUF342 family protein